MVLFYQFFCQCLDIVWIWSCGAFDTLILCWRGYMDKVMLAFVVCECYICLACTIGTFLLWSGCSYLLEVCFAPIHLKYYWVATSIAETIWLKLPLLQRSLYEDWRATSVWKLSLICIDHFFSSVCVSFVIQTQAKSSLTLSLREAVEI